MRIPLYACMAIALGLSVTPAANSATTTQYSVMTGGNCQLSIPTTDTKFRPKATGARNESATTSSFVICPFSITPSTSNASPVLGFYLTLYSLDGLAHNNVSCTAVTGIQTLGIPPVYSAKTADIPASGAGQLSWLGADFGGTNGNPITGSANLSVTCNLPPQTAIDTLVTNFNYEIGT
ncbi:MAG: hypothetical protein QM719_11680 [Thermomonas sp.]